MASFYVILCSNGVMSDNNRNERASVVLCREIMDEYNCSDVAIYKFPGELASQLYCELRGVNENNVHDFSMHDEVAVFFAEDFILDAVSNLVEISNEYMLRFIFTYCMSLNAQLFFSFMNHIFSFDIQFESFILKHQYKPWPVYKYAESLGLPYNKFLILFTEKFGKCPKEWFLHRRLERACVLLETTKMKIIDIAFESGFSSQSYFTDCFRKSYRRSPRDFRKKGSTSFLLERKNEL